MGDNAIDILIGLRDEASHKLNNVEKATLRSAESLKRQGQAFVGMGVAGISALALLTRSGVQYGESIDKMAKQTGMTTDQVQKLKYAAEQEHLSFEVLTRAVPLLTKNMNAAAEGNKSLEESFDEMGISVTDGEGNLKSAYDVLLDMADFMGDDAVGDSEKLAMALKILGKNGKELVPFLKMGREEIMHLGQEAVDLHMVMSEKNVKAADKFSDELLRMTGPLKQLGFEIGMSLLPLFEKWIDRGKQIIQWFHDLSPQTKESIAKFALMGSAALILTGGLMMIAGALKAITILGSPLMVKILLIALAFDGVYRILSMLQMSLGIMLEGFGKLFKMKGLEAFGHQMDLLGGRGMEEGGMGMLLREGGLGELMPGGIGGLAKTMLGASEVGKKTEVNIKAAFIKSDEALEFLGKQLEAGGYG